MQAGGILMLLSATLLFFILSNGIYPGSNTLLIPLSRFGAFFCIGIPISSIFFLLLLVRQFFGDTKQGGVGGDALIAGGFIWFATAFAAAILALGKMGRDGMLNPDSVAHHALTTVILSYGLVSASVSMFVGLTEISGVRRSSACPLIAFLGSTTWILCLLLLSTFNR
jgi:hypothetical protein